MENGTTIRDNLARNLRQYCQSKGSISKVCRELGINKQQFNRYLTGSTVPNETTLKKLCTYFKISEYELFAISKTNDLTKHIHLQRLLDIPGSTGFADNVSAGPIPSIPSGIYIAHIILARDPIEIACSTIIVRTINDLAVFKRLTNYSEPASSPWHFVRGDHSGLVIERAHWLYFMACADQGTGEPSMIAVQWMQIPSHLLHGIALLGTQSGPQSFPVVIESCAQDLSLRHALNRSRVVSITSTDLSAEVKSVIENHIGN